MRAASTFLLLVGCAPAAADLVVVNGGDAAVLDPQLAQTLPEARLAAALHAGLTRYHPQSLEPLPDLAVSWTRDAAARRWSFLLRPDARWSDGTPLTGADVVASWDRLVAPTTGAPYRAWLDGAHWTLRRGDDGGEVLEVVLPDSRPAFAAQCATWPLAVVHARLREAPPGALPDPFVSSGPFRLVRRRIGDRVRVERNPHSWRAAEVAVGTLDLLAVSSRFTALNLFLAGEAAWLPQAPRLAVPALLERRPDAFQPTPRFGTYFLRLRCDDPLLRDQRLRMALARALDRDRIAADLGGTRPPSDVLVPPLLPGAPRLASPQAFDPAAARLLLAAVRADLEREGRAAELDRLELLVPSTDLDRDLAHVLRDQWLRHLGLEVRIVLLEARSAHALERDGEFRISRSSWIGDYPDPTTFLELFRTDHPGNRTGWSDVGFDALLDRAATAGNATERAALLAEAEARLLAAAPVVPLLGEALEDVADPRLRGFHRNLLGYVDWASLSW